MVSQAKLAEFRDVLREMLDPIIRDNSVEELVLAIQSAALNLCKDGDEPQRRGIESSLYVGLNHSEIIKVKLYERFKLNYNFKPRTNSEILEWLMQRPETETVDAFADWYWADEWRRIKRGAPSLTEIYTLWPQAFEKPEYKSEQNKPHIFHAGDDE